jgi:ADP-dependent NAD(P)H-hydrate dehydratase / NAD(P)H-hydrate epimerase
MSGQSLPHTFSLSFPQSLYTAAQTRELDRLAIEDAGIAGDVLMTRAGEAAFGLLRRTWPAARQVAIVCGAGNNGGDGYVLALLAAHAGLHPMLYASAPPASLQGDALLMAERAQAEGVEVVDLSEQFALPDFQDADVVVDALLGTGLRGPVRASLETLVESINRSGKPVLSLDIPSGLNADSGTASGVVIRADHTITFIGVKRGLLTGDGPALTGELHFDDLQVPSAVFDLLPKDCLRPLLADLHVLLGRRSRTAHKGQCGHVLVVGGDYGYAGAALLAAQAAARCGAGLVSLATRKEHCLPAVVSQPEIMARGVDTAADLERLLERASVVVIGPGLGQSPWGRMLLSVVMASGLPRVIDADALNMMATRKPLPTTAVQVMTPHPGEAGRLLALATGAVQQDRFAAVRSLQKSYGGSVLLKGAGTLVATEGLPLALNTSGNPGMASGGMGDVLSGIVGALLAQGLSSHDAARYGALVHGLAGDVAVQADGERGLLASDLLLPLRRLLNDVG